MKPFLLKFYLVLTVLSLSAGVRSQVTYFKESFDNIAGSTAGGAGTYAFPVGWLLRNVDNRVPAGSVAYVNQAWTRREDFAFNLNDSAAFSTSWYSAIGSADDWMWTPPITIPNALVKLKWNALTYDAEYRDGYEVRIMVAPDVPGGGTGSIGNQLTNSADIFSVAFEGSTWTAREVSLAGYANKTVRIAFRNNSYDKFLLLIDDVEVSGEVATPLITLESQTNVSCYGGATGSAHFIVSGSTGPYTYTWKDSTSNEGTLNGASAGTYLVTVTDANSQSATGSVTITEPSLLSVSTVLTNTSCPGSTNGSIKASVSGGTPGYSYIWSPSGGTAASATGLAAGTYELTITDGNECTISSTSIVEETPAATVSSVSVPANGLYKAGDILLFTVNLTQKVIVETADGSPSIGLNLESGTRNASYESGSGSDALVFSYTVVTNDADANGISLSSEISLNGGSVTNGNSCPVILTLNDITSTSGIVIQNKKNQNLKFKNLLPVTYGDADFIPGAVVSSELEITYTSSNTDVAVIVKGKIRIIGLGTTEITASQEGNSDYMPAKPVTRELLVNPKPITVVATESGKTYGESDPVLAYSIEGSLVGEDVLSGSLIRETGENAGVYSILPGSISNSNYAISYMAAVFTITKASQSIQWNQLLQLGCNGATTVLLQAESNHGLTVTYTSANTSIATVNGNHVTLIAPGTASITAHQEGDLNHFAAIAVSKDFSSMLPGTMVVKKWSDVLVFDNSATDYVRWQWYRNEELVVGATRQYFQENGPLNGTYMAEAFTATGLSAKTCPMAIVAGVTPVALAIYPNPSSAGETVIVKTSFAAILLQGARIEVSNVQGTILHTISNVTEQTSVNMPVTPGLYIIRLRLSNGGSASVTAVIK
ncbi:MAG: MBG domain-containing protein [Chitinophagaceae bacterium]